MAARKKPKVVGGGRKKAPKVVGGGRKPSAKSKVRASSAAEKKSLGVAIRDVAQRTAMASARINRAAGASISTAEAERLRSLLPNPSRDSAIVAKAKMQKFSESFSKAKLKKKGK